jgi:carbon-monoxide dehydrogenase medium subunit
MSCFAYETPRSLHDALTLLRQAKGKGRVIAGGTDLILQLKRREFQADVLVDITEIEELRYIREKNGSLYIGAGVAHAEVAKSPLIQNGAKALADGCHQVGSPQIRNIATLVGNVISAQPAGDGAIPLMALEAELKVVSENDQRWVTIEAAYRGLGLSAIDPTKEVVTEVRFKKLGENGHSGFFRMARRKSFTLPILNGAVAILFDPSKKRIEKARIALGPVAERPFRPRRAEAYLESGEFNSETIIEACRIASDESNPRDSVRGSGLYRKEMIKVQLFRTIDRTLEEI